MPWYLWLLFSLLVISSAKLITTSVVAARNNELAQGIETVLVTVGVVFLLTAGFLVGAIYSPFN